ncbi:hypothetical protein COO60DRAFT_1640546 [Scenedesmus sp. NREL 46B-D3]|nr:hypothetical protein COO60DRAFT_1640546 [Scenedesmus sp. NREL 46B-D3]
MSSQAQHRELLEEKVRAAFLQLRTVENSFPAEAAAAQDHLRLAQQDLKALGEPRLLQQQRRGACWEVSGVLRSIAGLLPGLRQEDVRPEPDSSEAVQKASLELWREAEAIALQPHSFARLKQLPELRQSSATGVPAIHSCAGSLRQLAAAAQTHHTRLRGGSSHGGELADELFSAEVKGKVRAAWATDKDASLLQQLAPGLRLCLAAEVAAAAPAGHPGARGGAAGVRGEAWRHAEAELDAASHEPSAVEPAAAAASGTMESTAAAPAAALATDASTGSDALSTAAASPGEASNIVFSFIHSMAVDIILQFMEQAWESCGGAASPAWQQAVPLQVLLLCGQLQQLDAWARRCLAKPRVLLGSSSSSSNSSSSSCRNTAEGTNAVDQAQQQQQQQQQGELELSQDAAELDSDALLLLTKLTGMLQLVRQFKEANEALTSTAAAAAAAAAGAEGGEEAAVSTGGCGNGVLASSSSSSSSSTECMDPATFFSSTGPLASGVLGFAEPLGAGIFSSSSSSSSSSGGAVTDRARQAAASRGTKHLKPQLASAGSEPIEMTAGVTVEHPAPQQQQLRQELQQLLWLAALGNGTWDSSIRHVDRVLQQQLARPMFLSCAGRSCALTGVQQAQQLLLLASAQPAARPPGSLSLADAEAAELAARLREAGVAVPKGAVMACQAAVQVCAAQLMLLKGLLLIRVGLIGRRGRRLKQENQSERGARHLFEVLRQMGMRARVVSGGRGAADEDMLMTSSGSGSGSGSEEAEDGRQQQGAAAAGSSSSSSSRASQPPEVPEVEGQADDAADSAVSPVLDMPHQVIGCSRRWLLHARSAAAAAATAAAAETGLSALERRRLLRKGQAGCRRAAAVLCSQLAPLWAFHTAWLQHHKQATADASHWWSSALRSALQQQQHSSGSRTKGQPAPAPSLHEAVPYSDPFMWRRLLWQLLGKLSPEAQAFYAQRLARWILVRRSIVRVLWSPAQLDCVAMQLAAPAVGAQNERRLARLVQYARALNSGYVKGYAPGTVLLAQQLLLALSPLHAQLLPRPETAFLCPSSFRAAPASSSSSDGSGNSQFNVDDQGIDALYLDPEAKLFAVGFAARQLSGGSAGRGAEAAVLPAACAAATVDAAARVGAVRQPRDADRLSSAAAQQDVAHRYLEHPSDTVIIPDEEHEPEEQQQDEPAAAAAVGAGDVGLSDTAAAALQPPLPLDAFVEPRLWWQRQQELYGLDATCDGCGQAASTVAVCSSCLSAVYCSEGCLQLASGHHQQMCSKLSSARKRYAAEAMYMRAAGELSQAGPFPLVMQVLQAEPQAATLGLQCPGVFTCEAGIVPAHLFVQRAGEALASMYAASEESNGN